MTKGVVVCFSFWIYLKPKLDCGIKGVKQWVKEQKYVMTIKTNK